MAAQSTVDIVFVVNTRECAGSRQNTRPPKGLPSRSNQLILSINIVKPQDHAYQVLLCCIIKVLLCHMPRIGIWESSKGSAQCQTTKKIKLIMATLKSVYKSSSRQSYALQMVPTAHTWRERMPQILCDAHRLRRRHAATTAQARARAANGRQPNVAEWTSLKAPSALSSQRQNETKKRTRLYCSTPILGGTSKLASTSNKQGGEMCPGVKMEQGVSRSPPCT